MLQRIWASGSLGAWLFGPVSSRGGGHCHTLLLSRSVSRVKPRPLAPHCSSAPEPALVIPRVRPESWRDAGPAAARHVEQPVLGAAPRVGASADAVAPRWLLPSSSWLLLGRWGAWLGWSCRLFLTIRWVRDLRCEGWGFISRLFCFEGPLGV